MKTITFYLGEVPENVVLSSYSAAKEAIARGQETIHTANTHLFNTDTIIAGYILNVHSPWGNVQVGPNKDGTFYSVPYTPKELRRAHNLEKLLYGSHWF